jgi:hypothetical protein
MQHALELEALSNDMFAPLSEKEASLVVGGAAERPIGYCYYATKITWSDGGTSPDELIVDIITVEEPALA